MKIARSTGRRLGITAAIVACTSAGIFVTGTIPAEAATVSHSLTVSCNSKIVTSGVTVTQGKKGTFKVKQNSSSPVEVTSVWARDQKGHTLPRKIVNNGGTAKWTSVLPGKYTIRATIAATQDCNGIISFGDGNYKWKYTVTYTS
jgi:hypothetical protein